MQSNGSLFRRRDAFTRSYAKRAGCSLTRVSAMEAFIAEILGYGRPSSFGNVRLGHRHASEEAVDTLRAYLKQRRKKLRGLDFTCLLNPDAGVRTSPRSRVGPRNRVVRMSLKDRVLVIFPPLGAQFRVTSTRFGGRAKVEIAVR